jgi:antitoxin (DNA-binding transcriptional repressor) of toxin-antitoxin stability system
VVGVTAAYAYELPPDDRAPADAVHQAEGGQVVYLTRHGQRVAAIVPADQGWCWTEEWQAGEREADQELAEGRGVRFDTDEEFLAHLAAIRPADAARQSCPPAKRCRGSSVTTPRSLGRGWRRLQVDPIVDPAVLWPAVLG